MLCRVTTTMAFVVAIISAAAAQEASYSESRVAPSRVPAAFLKAAEKEAPGVRLATVYKDNEKGYRFVGKAADGRTYSVRIDRDGAVEWRTTYADVAPAKLPKGVAKTFQEEVAKNKDLTGFQVARTSLVERFNARKNETATYYEAFGHTPMRLHPRIEVDGSGKLLRVDTSFTPSTEDYTQRESLTANAVPPEVRRAIAEAAPGIKIARVFRVTTKGTTEPNYEAYGKVDRGRGVEVWINSNGHAYVIAMSIPLREVPRAALDAIERESRTDAKLVNFRPAEARRRRVVDIGQDQYQFFGDGPDGEPLDVMVNAQGLVIATGDSSEVIREEAGITSPEPRPKDAVATRGFAVLAARYGVDHHWNDVTDLVRAAATEGRKTFTTEKTPDPAFGRHKTTVLLYAMDGKVGLSEARDDEPLPMDIRQEASTLAPIPARGFAVLAARFGIDDKWEDVTASVRARVADGRLNFTPAEAKLTDPAPGEPKALAVAYAIDGKVGLYVQSQWRSPHLPPDTAPVNSESLLVRSIEFPQNPSLVAFTADNRSVVVGVEDGSVRMIDATTGREAHRFDGHAPGWLPVAVSTSGTLVASGGTDKVVHIWDVKTDREKFLLRGHTEPIFRLAFSPNGRYLASVARDNPVRLWDTTTGSEVRKFEGQTVVNGVKFTADGRQLVTASWDKTVRVWDVATGREVRKTETSGDELGDLAISKSGRDVFFGSKDGTLRSWEIASGKQPASGKVGIDAEWAIAALPDGHRVLLGDRIAAVVWDCKTMRPVLRLERHTGRISGVAVSPNGRRAATCGEDKTLKIWNLPDLGR
ncbi:MAG: repeat, subgroup [Planctomycetota bacterium]|nr:repeat, subgroup [Planctomycetota bacterium]